MKREISPAALARPDQVAQSPAGWLCSALPGVPSSETAGQLACELRRACGIPQFGRCDPLEVCAALAVEVEVSKLLAEQGGLAAMLLPTEGGLFEITVDPGIARQDEWSTRHLAARAQQELGRSQMQARVGHELGHTLFYDDQDVPERLRPPSEAEESFCDAFGRALLLSEASIRALTTAEAIGRFALAEHIGIRLAVGGALDLQPDLAVSAGLLPSCSSDRYQVKVSVPSSSGSEPMPKGSYGEPRFEDLVAGVDSIWDDGVCFVALYSPDEAAQAA